MKAKLSNLSLQDYSERQMGDENNEYPTVEHQRASSQTGTSSMS